MSQTVTIYTRAGELLVCSYSLTTSGRRVLNGLIVRLAGAVDDDVLAAAILRALDASADGVEDPPPTAGPPFQPILDELGLRTYNHFMKLAGGVELTRDGSVVVVTPLNNGGARYGFVPIGEIAETLVGTDGTDGADVDAKAIAQAARRGLAGAF